LREAEVKEKAYYIGRVLI